MKKDIILVLGPQGSGKTTQAKLLAEYLGFKFLSTGELLRQAKDENNPLGVKLAEYWSKGELVPDELIESILFPILEESDTLGFVIDGYPRDLTQLDSFISFLDLNNWELKDVIYLKLETDECIQRIMKRAEIEKRPDETEVAVARRLELYHSETEPLLEKYYEMGKLRKIDATPGISEIQDKIREQMSKYK